jgi:hypothetical protein
MTGETIRDLLTPVIGKSGSISVVVSRIGQIGFATQRTPRPIAVVGAGPRLAEEGPVACYCVATAWNSTR